MLKDFGPGVDPFPLAKRLTILGRGESARSFTPPPIPGQAIMLVNWGPRDASHDLIDLLKGRIVYIYANKEEPVLRRKTRASLSIAQVFWGGLMADGSKHRKRQKLERYGRPIQTLDDFVSLSEYNSVVSSGSLAILLGAKFASEIEIYGLDFYAGAYINRSYRQGTRRKELDILRPGGSEIARSVERIASAHPAVNFKLRTIAPQMVNSACNLEVVEASQKVG